MDDRHLPPPNHDACLPGPATAPAPCPLPPPPPLLHPQSFWDGEIANPDLEAMFRAEQADLLRDLNELPRNAAVRKINELVKRARMSRVHAIIIGHLRAQMPFFGQASAQKKMIDNM